jgi:DNA-binding GntR family transcriptional regulator
MGELAPGARLPALEAMASGYGCARETVRAALKELENVWITTKRGVGTFVVEHPPIFPAGRNQSR